LSIDRDEISSLYRGLSIEASYQSQFIWPSSFREDFLEIDQAETRIAHVFKDASYQTKFWFIWPSGFRGKDLNVES
jgi:nitrate reductase beta subunit